MPRSSLDRYVNGLGILAVISYAAMSVLSFVQTPALWDPAYFPHAADFFNRLFGSETVTAIRSFFGGASAVLISHGVILFVASAAAVALIILLSRDDAAPSEETAKLVFRWSMAFAGVSVFAYPVFTQDFWLSAIWGDMIASGINPYYQTFTPTLLAGLPLDHFSMTMSYGPLWGLVSAAVMTITGGSVWATAVLFKGLLLASWCASLVLVDRIMRQVAPGSRVAWPRGRGMGAARRFADGGRRAQRCRHGASGPALALPPAAETICRAACSCRLGALQIYDGAAHSCRCAS